MNKYSISYNDIVPADIESLLSDLGWKHLKTFAGKSSIWESKTGEKYWAPLDMSFSDYGDSIDALVSLISKSEKVSEDDAAAYIKQLYNTKDLIKLRVEADDVMNGTIGFEDGENLFSSLKSIIKSTLDEVSAIGKNFKTAFMNQSELSQTQHGSYIVTAYLPLLLEESAGENPAMENIPAASAGRLVNEAILRRLIKLKSVIAEYESSDKNALIEALMLEGFTLSECEAIELLFGKSGHRNWELDFIWSQKIHDTKGIKTNIRFDRTDSTKVNEVKKGFRKIRHEPETVLTGRVVKLERDYNEKEGIIKISTRKDKKNITVSVHVNDQQYRVAHNANENKKVVRIKGTLLKRKSGRYTSHVMPVLDYIRIVQDDMFDLTSAEPAD